MGLLSGLFGGSRPKPDSFVLTWAEKWEREVRKHPSVTYEKVFPVFMLIVASFGSNRKVNKEMLASGLDFAAHYVNDSVLFEVGCHTYALADQWLFSNRPTQRSLILAALSEGFIHLFTEALQVEYVAKLFRHRVDRYKLMFRSGGDWLRYLCLGVLRAKDNRKPDYYEIEDEPLLMLGAFESFKVKNYVAIWLETYATVLPKMLEEATALFADPNTRR